MNLETYLSNDIPLAEASAYFINLKQASAPSIEDLAQLKLAELEVQAMGAPGAMGASMGSPAALPPTAAGKNMTPTTPPALSPTAMGQNKIGSTTSFAKETGLKRVGQLLTGSRAKALEGRAEHLLSRAGSVAKPDPRPVARAQNLKELMGHWGKEYERKQPILDKLTGAAKGHSTEAGKERLKSFSARAGVAGAAGLGAAHATGGKKDEHSKAASAFKLALQQAGLTPQLDPETQQYLATEQQATQQAEAGEAAYLRQQLEQARAEQQGLEQQAQAAQEQAAQLEQTQAMHDQQLQQYQAQVADSTQKAMASQDQILQQQQAAAAMRMAYQQLRGTLLQAASTDPPSLTPGMPGADAAQAAMSQAAGASSAPAPTAGPAGQAPNPGTPGTVAPEGDDTVSAPIATGDSKATAEPAGVSGQKDQQKVATLADHLTKLTGVLPYAAGGAAVGAGLGALEARHLSRPGAEGAEPNLAQKHPKMTMGAGALSGALAGAGAGLELPGVIASAKRTGARLPGMAANLKTIMSKGAA